jgi:hypothetical protein
MKNNQFSFLVCSERSGSNFVTKVLDSHSRICGPSPIHLLRYFAPLEVNYGDLANNERWNAFLEDVLTFYKLKISAWDTELSLKELATVSDRSLAAVFRFIYRKEAEKHGKEFIFVKENHAYRLIPYCQDNFPNSKFIWAVRDPRDMALSWKKDAVLRGGIIRSANIWKEDQKNSLYMYQYLLKAGRMIKVRYEDLISDTAHEAKRMTDHLGLDFEEQMVSMQSSSSSAKNAEASVNWANLSKGVMKDNSRKYLKGLSKEEIQFIEYLCKEEMKAIGYELEFPVLAKNDFLELQHKLSLEEKFEKEEYNSISEAEKEKRTKWVKWVQQLQAKYA